MLRLDLPKRARQGLTAYHPQQCQRCFFRQPSGAHSADAVRGTPALQLKGPVMDSSPEHSRSNSRKITVKAEESILTSLPISILTDSYKTTHFLQYPDSQKMVAVCIKVLCQVSLKLCHRVNWLHNNR